MFPEVQIENKEHQISPRKQTSQLVNCQLLGAFFLISREERKYALFNLIDTKAMTNEITIGDAR